LHAFLAAGADLDAADNTGETARQVVARQRRLTTDPAKVEAARRDIAIERLDFVRYRALAIWDLHRPSITATRRIAAVRNPDIRVRSPCAADCISHLVEDCDDSQAFFS